MFFAFLSLTILLSLLNSINSTVNMIKPCAVVDDYGNCLRCPQGTIKSVVTGLCYDCSSPDITITGSFFVLKIGDEDQCATTPCNGSGNLIISGTKECIDSGPCPGNYFLFNSVCYEGGCPENTLPDSKGKQICLCAYYYYKTGTDPIIYECLPPEKRCRNEDAFIGTNKRCYDHTATTGQPNEHDADFQSDCPSTKKLKIIRISDSVNNYQCLDSDCDDDHFKIDSTHLGFTLHTFYSNTNFCVKECPKFHDRDRNCVDCVVASGTSTLTSPYVQDEKTMECLENIDNCQSPLVLLDINAGNPSFYKCLYSETCPEQFPFFIPSKKACIKECGLISTNGLDASGIYDLNFISSDDNRQRVKLCLYEGQNEEYCERYNLKKEYALGVFKKCVEKCADTDLKYKNLCAHLISDFNSADITGVAYVNEDTRELYTDGCPEDYFKCEAGGDSAGATTSQTLCTKNCNNCDSKTYLKVDSKECVADTGCFVYNDETPNKCYTECDQTHPYFPDGVSNPVICFNTERGCSEGKVQIESSGTIKFYKYVDPSDNIHKCLESCPTKSTENYICVTDCPTDFPYLYKTICYEKGCPDPAMITRYESEKNYYTCLYPENCKNPVDNTEFYYVQERKCVSNCDIKLFPYIIEKDASNHGICLKDYSDCRKLAYYYFYDKGDGSYICYNVLPASPTYLKLENDPLTGIPYNYPKGNLFIDNCPSTDFIYKNRVGDKCVKECPSDEFITPGSAGTSPQCTSSCATYLLDHKCITSCEGTSKPFHSTDSPSSSTPGYCLEKCPDEKYVKIDGEKKICVDNCDLKLYNPKTKECAKDISGKSCLGVIDYEFTPDRNGDTTNNFACLSECPSNYYYSEIDKKCVKECPTTQSTSTDPVAYPYNYPGSFKCVKSCKYHEAVMSDATGNPLKTCLSDCPENFYWYPKIIAGPPNIEIKVCVNNCQLTTTPNYNYALDGTKECVDSCPADKPFLYNGICFANCPTGNKYFDVNKKCFSKCMGDLYHNFGSYKCIPTCDTDHPYLIEKEYICYEKCPSSHPYYYAGETGSTYEGKKLCVHSCPSTPSVYYNKNGYECIVDTTPHCDTNYYYDEETKKCVKKCPEERPYRDVSTPTDPKCVSNCPFGTSNFISFDKECISDTSSSDPTESVCGTHKFIGRGNTCKDYCDPKIDGKYFTEIPKSDNSLSGYYRCQDSCSGIIVITIYGVQCITEGECGLTTGTGPYRYYYLSKATGLCLRDCNLDTQYPFAIEDNNQRSCSDTCPITPNYPYHLSDNKCIAHCESPNPFYNEKKECVSSCLSSINKYYIPEDPEQDQECLPYCPDTKSKHIIGNEGYKCVDPCPTGFNYLRDGNECADSCDKTSSKPFASEKIDPSTSSVEVECIEKCPLNQVYYKDKMECLDNCEPSDAVIEGTQICLTDCDAEHPFKYIPSGATTDTFSVNTCVSSCMNTDKKFADISKECSNGCTSSLCTLSDSKSFYKESDQICECGETCPSGYSADSDSNANKKCSNKCSYQREGVPSDLTLNQFYHENFGCVESCEIPASSTKKYFIPPDHTCIEECPEQYYIYEDTSTDTNYQCLKNCAAPEDHGAVVHDKTKSYADKDRKCQGSCNDSTYGNIFVLKKFEHGEIDIQPRCLKSCPETYPYIIAASIAAVPSVNVECFGSCGISGPYFIRQSNYLLCQTVCQNDFPFLLNDKECVAQCPPEKPYAKKFISGYTNIVCDTKCPPGTFHYVGLFECLDFVGGTTEGFVNYESGLWVNQCDNEHLYWGRNIDGASPSSHKKYCLKECNKDFGFFITPRGECVKSCSDTDSNMKFLVPTSLDTSRNECICESLHYYDEDPTVPEYAKYKCAEASIHQCSNLNDNSYEGYGYIIEKFDNPNICVKTCATVLSSDRKCMEKYECPQNSEIKLPVINRCSCKYLWYVKDIVNDINECLMENQECPKGLNFIIKSTGQCVASCPGTGPTLSFLNYCYESCPDNTNDDNGDGICDPLLNYIVKESVPPDFEFFEGQGCPEDYPLLSLKKITDLFGECVKKCEGSSFIKYGNKCLPECGTDKYLITTIDNKYTCQCNFQWYYTKNVIAGIICKTEETVCNGIENEEFFYEVAETKECVKECPYSDPFLYSNKCYKSCSKAEKDSGTELKENPTKKKCECPKLWKRKVYEVDGKLKLLIDQMECLTTDYCKKDGENEYVLLTDTRECYEGKVCPTDYIQHNEECFRPTVCKENAENNEAISDLCICPNLWYFKKNQNDIEDKICLPESVNECPFEKEEYRFEMIIERQCRDKCVDPAPYSFNFKCYEECPEGTIEYEDTKKCICNGEYGKWFKTLKNNAEYLVCGLEECPSEFTKIIFDSQECVNLCDDENPYYYLYNPKICYANCPDNLIDPEDDKVCTVRDLNTPTDLPGLQKQVMEDILYLIDINPLAGITFEKYNVSLQIYQINKDKSILDNEELIKRNNLTFLNLDNCIEDIYKTNTLTDDTNILVTKYDVLDKTDNYLIKPVEYEFFNSKTGAKLDASVCKVGEVLISYPLSFNIRNHGEQFNNETEIQKLKRLFNYGKELKSKNEKIDIFNYNSPVYSDICIPLQFEGKDVVLKDRRNELFPNITVCENNCTPSYTDYNQERVVCQCDIKTELDLYRNHGLEVVQYSEKDTNEEQRSPTSFGVVKCIKNLKDDSKNTVKENGAFYVTVLALVAQVGLVFTSALYGLKIMKRKIERKNGINKNKEEENNLSEAKNLPSDLASPPKKEIDNSESESSSEQPNNNKKNINNNYKKNNYINIERINDPSYENKNKKETNNNDTMSYNSSENSPSNNIINNKKFNEKNKGDSDLYERNNRLQKQYIENADDKMTGDYEINYNEINNTDESLAHALRKEDKKFRKPFGESIVLDDSNIFVLLLAEVLTRVYLTNIFLLKKKYNLASLFASLYIVYHIILLTLSAGFFDINTISKIYYDKDFPNLSHYLLYGAISMVIAWIAYGLLAHLISFDRKIREVFELKKSSKKVTNEVIKAKFDEFNSQVKKGTIYFFIISFIILIFSFFYLVLFCGVFTGTKRYVFNGYGITLAEIAVIKLIYGLIIGLLRYISLRTRCKCLYNTCRIFDAYLI